MILTIEINHYTINSAIDAIKKGGYYGKHTFPTECTMQITAPDTKEEEKDLAKVCAALIRYGINFTFDGGQ